LEKKLWRHITWLVFKVGRTAERKKEKQNEEKCEKVEGKEEKE
jgi:hypothetical protein